MADVSFTVEFEDGTTETFDIDETSLRSGDHVARQIARERQEKGELPKGPIKSVRRTGR